MSFRKTVSERERIRAAAAANDQPMRNQQAINLLGEWLADNSGYDERVWPELKKSIEERRLGRRKRFAT
jgi:hypothetical protein